MIRTLNIFITAVLVLFTGWSCNFESLKGSMDEGYTEPGDIENYTKENTTVNGFIEWCTDKENKLNKVKELSDIEYNLSYLPAESMAFLELRTEAYDLSKFQKAKEGYTEMTYFNFKIKIIKGSGELLKYQLRSPSQYEARVKYMAFEMENDLYLVQGKDTIAPGLYHFERIYEVAPYATVMFAFDNTKFNKDQEFTVVYNDRLFDKGFVKFNYKNNQLINLPNISAL